MRAMSSISLNRKRMPFWLLAAALLLGSSAMLDSAIAQGATAAATTASTPLAAPAPATTPAAGSAAVPATAPAKAPLSVPGLEASTGFAAIPALTSHVNDHAGMLDASQRSTLDQVLTDYETRTGSQIAVLLINSTAPEAIEQYGIRVADAWKIGRAKVDDGVILIVAKDNPKSLNRLRIEAGRGVQGSLTDAQSKRVLEDVIAPYFRKNDYYGGLTAGVTALTTLLDHEQLPVPANNGAAGQGAANTAAASITDVLPLIFMIVVGGFVLFSRIRSGSGQLSSNVWGNAAGVVIGSLLSQSGRGGGGGGFGGGGGGGFSGGGGGFDGGGASGNW